MSTPLDTIDRESTVMPVILKVKRITHPRPALLGAENLDACPEASLVRLGQVWQLSVFTNEGRTRFNGLAFLICLRAWLTLFIVTRLTSRAWLASLQVEVGNRPWAAAETYFQLSGFGGKIKIVLSHLENYPFRYGEPSARKRWRLDYFSFFAFDSQLSRGTIPG